MAFKIPSKLSLRNTGLFAAAFGGLYLLNDKDASINSTLIRTMLLKTFQT
jgi:hypothetical protein